ncbi:MAG: IMP dehydrogenase [Bdellovibrionaceae bacterium]|nr:IMP dehydrogenase [Pseudobdellovibrionaceae bacterium]MCO5114721.1 IMP dehydrogenase [Pseudobdellovibrionaceae bacterium]
MEIKKSLTFDDILLVPQFSEAVPTEVEPRTFFARDIHLNTPVLSAAMDTVTESKVARVMAQLGGLGIIHKNLSIEQQAAEVEKVKKYESGMIQNPITLSPEHKVSDALELMKHWSISGVPITVGDKLVGILTNRDLRFETNTSQMIANVMTSENLVTAKEGTTLEDAKKILQKHRIEKLPVVNKDNVLKGLITIKDIEKAQTYPKATKDALGQLLVGAATGIGTGGKERVEALVAAGANVIAVDTAHGHSKNVLEMVEWVSQNFKDVIVVAGNVVTAEATEELIKRGADVVKVGVGSGSICTTRIVSGVGVPQITAIIECAQKAKKLGKTIIADGGIKFSGDVTKALAVGANTVMLGNMLAGCDESPGETILYQGRTYKVYRGMGSIGAMKLGSKDRYFQDSVSEHDKLVPEGIEGRVPYKGSVSGIIHQIIGGLKSGMGYVGATSIQDLQDKARFVEISSQGLRESHVHDVTITKEAPNYRLD